MWAVTTATPTDDCRLGAAAPMTLHSELVPVNRLEDLLMLRLSRCLNCRPTMLQRRSRQPVQIFGKTPSRSILSNSFETKGFCSDVQGNSVKLDNFYQSLNNKKKEDDFSPESATDPLACRSRLDASMQMFKRKVWRPFQLQPSSGGGRSPPSSNGIACRPIVENVPHTCRRRRPMSSVQRSTEADANQTAEAGSTIRPRSSTRRRPQSVPSHLMHLRSRDPVPDDNDQDRDLDQPGLDLTDVAPILSSRVHDWRDDKTSDQETDIGNRKPVMELNLSDDEHFSDNEEEKTFSGPGANPHKLNLRAEVTDSSAEYKGSATLGDPLAYDFDANVIVDLPEYEFESPLPDGFEKIDFRKLAISGKSWRDTLGEQSEWDLEAQDRDIMDRLLDLERQQIDTEHAEGARRDQLRTANQEKQEQLKKWRATGQVQRIQSARTRAQKSKNCCANCLQTACAGDCPLKFVKPKVCFLCRQPFCNGTCAKTSYDEHSRLENAAGEEEPPSASTKTRTCTACPTNKARRAPSAGTQRTSRLRGRSALSPGKSRVSNRKDSITLDLNTMTSNNSSRINSAQKKRSSRPKSAI